MIPSTLRSFSIDTQFSSYANIEYLNLIDLTLKRLIFLNFSVTHFIDTSFVCNNLLERCTSLSTLGLRDRIYSAPYNYNFLRSMPHLKSLSIGSFWTLCPHNAIIIGGFVQLEDFSFSFEFRHMSPSYFRRIGQAFPSVRRIRICNDFRTPLELLGSLRDPLIFPKILKIDMELISQYGSSWMRPLNALTEIEYQKLCQQNRNGCVFSILPQVCNHCVHKNCSTCIDFQ